jgi:hypothetical protein
LTAILSLLPFSRVNVEYMVFLVSKLVFFAIGLDAILPGFTL